MADQPAAALMGEEVDPNEGESDVDYEVEEEYTEEEEEDYEDGQIEELEIGDGPATLEDAEEILGLREISRQLRNGPEPKLKRAPPPVFDFVGFPKFPAPVQESLQTLIQGLQKQGRNSLTIMLLGKAGSGKTALMNALFNERVGEICTLQSAAELTVLTVTRKLTTDGGDFLLTALETPCPLEGDIASPARMSLIQELVTKRPVDVIVLVDRLDMYRVEAVDKLVIETLTEGLGKELWSKAIIGLTHANMTALPPGVDYEEMVAARTSALRDAVRSASGNRSASLPEVLIENGSRFQSGQLLPNGVSWLPNFVDQVGKVALSSKPYLYNPKSAAKVDPNKRWRWLIPLLLAGQIFLKFKILDPLMERDGWQGDQYGPFDPDFAKEEKVRQERRKAERRARAERDRLKKQRAAMSRDLGAARGRALQDSDDSSDSD